MGKGLQIGDRVSRQIRLGEPERRFGVIVEKYKSAQSFINTPYLLFSVKWDNSEEVQSGYLEVGLQKEDNDS